MFTLPIVLTVFRLIFPFFFIPLLVCFFDVPLFRTCGAFLFLSICMTDFFDGYFARKYKQQTVLGKVLDPIADKVLILGPLLVMVSRGFIHPYIAFLLLSRDLIISALRYAAAELHFDVPVSKMGKIKSLFFDGYMTWMIADIACWGYEMYVSQLLLGVVVILSVTSGLLYVYSFMHTYQNPERLL